MNQFVRRSLLRSMYDRNSRSNCVALSLNRNKAISMVTDEHVCQFTFIDSDVGLALDSVSLSFYAPSPPYINPIKGMNPKAYQRPCHANR